MPLVAGCTVTTSGGTRNNVIGFSTAYSGVQAERVRVPFADANVFLLPDGVSDEQALFLTDILPTAEMVVQFAEVKPGDRVVIEGTQRLRPGVAVRVLNTPQEQNS